MSKMMVKRDGLWTPMTNLKGDIGPLPEPDSVTNDALVTDGAKTNTAYLMGNRLTATAEGEMVSVDDSYPSAALSLTVDGKSTQVTTTGKNLLPTTLPDNAIHASINGDSGYAQATIVSASNAYVFAIPCERNTDYIFSSNTNGTISIFGLSDRLPVLNDTCIKIITMTNLMEQLIHTGENDYILIQMNNASAMTNFPTRKAMLEKGSVKTDYEPYSGGAASPRPDWPQEIESVDGILLTTCGKNFVPNDDPEKPTANYTFNSSKRVVWDSENEGFRLTDSGIGIAYAAHISRNPRAAFIAPRDGVYTFGADTKYYTSGTDFGFRAELNGAVINGYGWGSPKQTSDTEWTRHSITRTLSKGDRFGATIYQTVLWRNISVAAGSEDIYEPYSGGTASLLPEGTSLRSLPDGTKDELYLTYLRPSSREGWAWYSRELVKKINTVTFDGSERWVANGTWNGFHIARPSDSPSEGLSTNAFLNTRGIAVVHSRAGLASALGATSFGSDSINYNWDNKTGTSYSGHLTEFKTWLTENNMMIQYLLATPITTQLDPIELPIMQAGTTNIWTDPSTSLSVTYERDRNIVISKLEAAAADLATS